MTEAQEQQLTEKLTQLGYPTFEIMPGMDNVLMLHIDGHLICGARYALEMADEALKALISETLQVAGGQD